MTIAKSDILTQVRARTGRGTAISSIDTELASVLRELSALVYGACEKTATVTISTGNNNSLPSDMQRAVSVADSTGILLDRVKISDLLALNNADSDEGTASKWARWGGKLYVWPTPAASTTYTVYYYYEEDDVDSIGLDDVFQEALIEGVCHKVELGLGVLGAVSAEAITHKRYYDEQVQILQSRYNDSD